MDFEHNIYIKSKSKFYTYEHDKYLVYANYSEGYSNFILFWNLVMCEVNWVNIRQAIKKENLFRFDHFFKYL